jgi:hypothetical protein
MPTRRQTADVNVLAGESAPRNTARNTLLVLSIGLLMRLAVACYAVVHFPAGWFYTRGMEMGLLARSLVYGLGLSSPYGPPTGPTAIIGPGYPLLVAGVFRLFGVLTLASSLVILGLHIALNLLTIWMILRVSRRFVGEPAAMAVGLFWACSLPLVWMPTIFWETNLSACLLLGFVLVALDLNGESSLGAWMLCGTLCAMAGLINPALLPVLFCMLLWCACKGVQRRHWVRPLLAGAAFLALFSPWPIRNATVFHAFIPTRTTVGFELWMGNHPGATGYLDESLFPTFNTTELHDYEARGEVGYAAHKEALAKDYIVAHPGVFVVMTLRRMLRFWTGSGNSSSSPVFVAHAVLTTLLGACGLFFLLRSARRRLAPAFLLPMLLFPLPYYITHAEFRYRLVLDPVLTVLAAFALDRWFARSAAPAEETQHAGAHRIAA